MKTIIANFTEMKTNISQEDSDADLNINDVEESLKSVGIQLRDSTGQIKNLDAVIDELGIKWGTLDRNTQRYLATTIAGSRQQSRLIALLDDYDRTMELQAIATDSAGQAELQFAKYQDTVESKINKVRTAWEELRQSLINSDEIKTILDFVVNLLNKINNFDLSKTSLLLTASIIPIAKKVVTDLISSFKTSASDLREVGELFSQKIKEGFNQDREVDLGIQVKADEEYLQTLKEKLNEVTVEGVANGEDTLEEQERLKQEIASTEENIQKETLAIKQQNESFEASKRILSSVGSSLLAFTGVLINGGDAVDAFKAAMAVLIPQLVSFGLECGIALIKNKLLTASKKEATAASAEHATVEAADAIATAAQGEAAEKAAKQNKKLSTSQQGVSTSGGGLTKILSKMKGLMGKTGLVGAIIAAVVALSALAVSIYDSYKKYKQAISVTEQLTKVTERLEEAQRNYSDALDQTKTQQTNISSLQEAVKTYEELNDIVNRTEEQEASFTDAISVITEQYPEILSYYDEENNKIAINNDLYQKKIDLLNQEKEEQDKITQFYNVQQIQLKKNKAILENMSKLEDQSGLEFNAQKGMNDEAFSKMINRQYDSSNVDKDILEEFWKNINDAAGNTDIDFDESKAKKAWDNLYGNATDGLESLDTSVQEVLNDWKNSLNELNDINNNFSDYYSAIYSDLVSSGKYKNNQEAGIAASVMAGAYDSVDNISVSYDTSGDIYQQAALDGVRNAALNLLSGNPFSIAISGLLTNEIEKISKQQDMTDDIQTAIEEIQGAESNYAIEQAEKYQHQIEDITNDPGFIRASDEWEDLEDDTKATLEKIGIDTKQKYEDYVEGLTDAELSDQLTEDILNAEIAKFQDEIKKGLQDFFDEIEGQNFLEDASNFINDNMYESTNEEILNKIENFKDLIEEKVPQITDEMLDQILIGMGFDPGLLGENKTHPAFEKAAELLGKQVETYKNEVSLGLAQAINSANARIIQDTDSRQLAKDMVSNIEKELSNSNLSDKVQQIFYGIDWTSFDVGTMNLDDFLDDIAEANNLTNEEREELQGVAKIAQDYGQLDTMVDTLAEADNYVKTLNDTMKALYEDQSSYVSVITEQINDGEVSLESYLNLKDKLLEQGLNPQDYFNIDSMGKITTNEETIKKLYEDQIVYKKQQLKIKLDEATLQREELKNQLNIIEAQIESVKSGNGLIPIYNDQIYQTGLIAQNWYTILSLIGEATGKEYSLDNYKINLDGVNQYNASSVLNILESQADLIKTQVENADSSIEVLQSEYDNFDNEAQAHWRDFNKNIQDGIKENNELADSLDKVNEAQEKVIEAQNELNEALYGEKYHKNALNFMYNYETALESVQRTADKAKEAIDDLSVDTDINKNLQDYQNAIHKEAVLLKAESAEYQQAIDNFDSVIKNQLKGKLEEINAMNPAYNVSTDIANYLYQGEGGMYYINYDALNLANIPDDFSDFLEESADQMNEWTKAILDNEDKLAEREKEIEEMHEQAIDNRVSLEERVQDILKQKYEEEVSDVEEKYSAMEEANDEYLSALEDALQKERDLRERSNQWEELAQKEKKLSLMQRDTSGANQADVLNLQNEIQDDREQLLDDTVDDILNTLKEQYELQKESHEQEIEFRNAMLEDSNLSAMAAEVINSWPSYEAALDWFYQNDQEFAEASDAKREQLTNEWIELYNNSKAYDQINYDEIKAALYTTDQEVQAKMDEVTETATNEGERLLNQTTDDVKQSINDAQQALTDALESLAEAQQEYAEAVSKGLNSYTKLNGLNPDGSSSDTKTNSNNTKAYNTRLEAETAARTLAQAGNTGITIDEKDGKYYVNYTKKSNKASSNNQNNFIGPIKPDMTEEKQAASQQIKQTLLSMTAPDNKVAYRYILSDSDRRALNVDQGAAIYGNYKLLTTTIKTARDVGLFDEEDKGILQSKEDLFGNLDTITGWGSQDLKIRSTTRKYATGGLVDYTGPAWVDGTRSKPEAFLSSDDTRRIGEAAELLSKLPILNSTSTSETQMASSIGDTSIEIHINIDKIESDYDVDSMIERVRQDIVDVANPTGTVQILRK